MATVALSLGTNLGDQELNLDNALRCIEADIGPILCQSSRLRTKPVLHSNTPTFGQSDFINMVVLTSTNMPPIELLDACQAIENKVGRDRSGEKVRWQARVLDVDIIAIDNTVVELERLIVPHERMHERAFVLQPMSEVWPEWKHPKLALSVLDMLQLVRAEEIHESMMRMAINRGQESLAGDSPRPMAAVLVQDGKVIAYGNSQVSVNLDPTAHAEIEAIRAACLALKTCNLENAIMYCTGEPCPMCLAAIYHAGIKTVYYGLSNAQTGKFGFADAALYQELSLPKENQIVNVHQCLPGEVHKLFSDFAKLRPGYKSSLFRNNILDEPAE